MAGTALAVLRTVAGLAVIAEGIQYFAFADSTSGVWLSGFLNLGAGLLLVAGFLTPFAVGLVLLWGAAMAASLLPPPLVDLFGSRTSLVFGATMLLVIAAIGPGAFSADARLFGRREIIIPRDE